jgi:hypothetical protein
MNKSLINIATLKALRNTSDDPSNDYKIALKRYLAIPNNTPRKIAWIGDSVTMNRCINDLDTRDQTNVTVDTPDSIIITSISNGLLTSITPHNARVGTIVYVNQAVNGFTLNSYYVVSSTPSPTTLTVTNLTYINPTLTDGTGLTITMSFNRYENSVARFPSTPMYKVTNGAFWGNGQSASGFFDSIGVANTNTGFERVVEFSPDLIVYGYGINDVRLGNTTQARLEITIANTIQALKQRLPKVDIILLMPNHLCLDSATVTTYLGAGTTLAQCQARSDSLRLAYRNLKNKFSNCYVFDTQGVTLQFTLKNVQALLRRTWAIVCTRLLLGREHS